ncbi:glycosyltransferase family 2 protein [Atractiella rhizophila]|nr:glycosyltransferase family 2 protein [Atractiella rhizophila]
MALSLSGMMMKDKLQRIKEFLAWGEEDMTIGREKVYLSDIAFRELEDLLRVQDEDEMRRIKEKDRQDLEVANGLLHVPVDPLAPFPTSPMEGYGDDYGKMGSSTNLPANIAPMGVADDYPEDSKTFYSTDDYFSSARALRKNGGYDDEGASAIGSERFNPSRNLFDADRKTEFGEKAAYGLDMQKPDETVEEIGDTSARKKWVFLTWLLTWWIPSPLLSWVGRMKRRDVRMAWREKLAINMLIWLLCGVAVFIIAFLGNLICPREYVYTQQEVRNHGFTNNAGNMLVSINGEVFDLTDFAPLHSPGNDVIPTLTIQKFGGTDISALFPLQPSALCNGVDGTISPFVGLDYSNASTNLRTYSKYHDFRASTNDYRPDWYYEQMIFLRYNYRRGFVGYTKGDVHKRRLTYNTVIYRGGVYDMTDYINAGGGVPNLPDNTLPPADVNYEFMDPLVVALFQQKNGQDITKEFDSLPLSADQKQIQRVCLRNLFFIGKQDNRRSPQCLFSQYILLGLSILLASVIGFKFLAALQFGRSKQPEDHEKFVICQVPCYTEGEESLRKCIDSLAQLKYDDKRKLLFIVCDGMIIGSGNDRPTPRIVLDILGCDPTLDPEPLSFLSIGDGAKQHNMGKVYSGLHESAGHIVPYLVVVKVGKPSERSRPGNRGKRDSQMLVMRFLNRVHFDAPMAPLELEIFHQIKNVIGVNPTFYEYVLQVDADTVVDKLSLNRMVSSMMHDKKIMGLCGETSLANARHSFTTMIQVYEYFISHHLAKAFESLFGSVTCLPGCFSLYRIRTSENKPLLINNQIVQLYGENRVDTLHMKNLLHLGEDRYLTTLMLKQFPKYKNIFIRDAYAQTIAPDEWSVLFSQRRRWINSTVHNLAELLMIERMCGFCLFSMRFVVFLDLFSTLIAPVSVAYIVYLVYLVVAQGDSIPITSIILLGAVYGLQALIFIFHRKFEHIGWMIVYILAIPIFSFLLPLLSFWQMDNFSWGNTRVVLGEKGQRLVVHDEGKFDPAEIPLKRWHEYEEELWERGSNKSIGSLIEESKRKAMGDHSREGSLYGRQSTLGGALHSRAQ